MLVDSTSVNWSVSNNTEDMVVKWVLKTRSDKYKHWHLIDAVFTPMNLNYTDFAACKQRKLQIHYISGLNKLPAMTSCGQGHRLIILDLFWSTDMDSGHKPWLDSDYIGT